MVFVAVCIVLYGISIFQNLLVVSNPGYGSSVINSAVPLYRTDAQAGVQRESCLLVSKGDVCCILLRAVNSVRLMAEFCAHSASMQSAVVTSFSCRPAITWGQYESETLASWKAQSSNLKPCS